LIPQLAIVGKNADFKNKTINVQTNNEPKEVHEMILKYNS